MKRFYFFVFLILSLICNPIQIIAYNESITPGTILPDGCVESEYCLITNAKRQGNYFLFAPGIIIASAKSGKFFESITFHFDNNVQGQFTSCSTGSFETQGSTCVWYASNENTTTFSFQCNLGGLRVTSIEVEYFDPDISSYTDDYEFYSVSPITTTAHLATPIAFCLKNRDMVKEIEFDFSTSIWLNATGEVHEYDHSASETGEPWLDCYSFDFYNDFPYFFTVTERVTNIEEDWRYLFGFSDLCEHANILNGVVSVSGFGGHVVFKTTDNNNYVFSDYIEPGNGALFSMNLLYPLKSGEHSIDVSNIKITLEDGTEIELDPFTINITAESIPGDMNDDGVLDENDLPAGSSAKMVANAGNLVDGRVNTSTLIPVKIENDFAISSFSLKVKLPDRIELVNDISSFLIAGERGENFSFAATQNTDGTITIVGTSTTPLAAGQGAVLNLNVKTSWQNTYPIPLTEMKVTTPEGVVVSLPDSETKLIMQGERGDMNGDGRVDLSDALYIINMTTGLAQ